MTTTINQTHNDAGRSVGRPVSPAGLWNWLKDSLFQPVSIGPLVFLRVSLGLLLMWEVQQYFEYDRISRYYSEPSFYFTYYGFDFLHPLPLQGMVALFYFIAFLSFCVTIGLLYRVAAPLLWLCFTYVFLLDQAQYLNHFYLISLLCLLMIFIPAHRALSIDAWLFPALRSRTAPAWSLWLVRGQMTVVYVFGGIAKLNGDWLRGEPLRLWLNQRLDFPVIGQFFNQEWMAILFTYGGLLFDLFIVPLLLWRRTRIPALIVAIGFHITNSEMFNIGIFPWLAIAITLLFMPPHWFALPRLKTLPGRDYAPSRLILTLFCLYFAIQILLPLRHFLYPSDVSWAEEGHNLSWHMRLRDKEGEIQFIVADPATGSSIPINQLDYLTERQQEQMAHRPDMILQFAHFLDEELQRQGYSDPQVYVWALVSLNTRPPQLLIDPTVDLSEQPRDLGVKTWILPLAQPLHENAIPILLIARHADDQMVLANVGFVPFPLHRLTLRSADQTLSDDDYGAQSLLPAECLFTDEPIIYAACNHAGSAPLLNGPIEILIDNQPIMRCEQEACLVTIPAH
jgi:vitamin K-dependent gamma-carboxylase